MTRLVLAAALLCAIPAIALARDETPADKGNGLSVCEEQYLTAYEKVVDKLGTQAPGRNFVAHGIVKADGTAGPINNERACAEVEDLKALIAPPPVETTTYTETAPAYSGGTTGAIPSYITECESGGDYGAYNPSSGATGAYQIIPSTAAAYGCDLSTPAGQDACAGEIYAAEGSSAWVCG